MVTKQDSKNEEVKDAKDGKPAGTAQTLRWDDSRMTSTYANVCNVSSTREEVTLLFGTNQSWQSKEYFSRQCFLK